MKFVAAALAMLVSAQVSATVLTCTGASADGQTLEIAITLEGDVATNVVSKVNGAEVSNFSGEQVVYTDMDVPTDEEGGTMPGKMLFATDNLTAGTVAVTVDVNGAIYAGGTVIVGETEVTSEEMMCTSAK